MWRMTRPSRLECRPHRSFISLISFFSLSLIFFRVVAFQGAATQAFAQTAAPVTNIQAIQHDGQTFITWKDAAAGQAGERYRYDLYRSTAGPITDLDRATLVQRGIYNNSGQLLGPKPFTQATRQNAALAMSKIHNGGPSLPPWSGLGVYTNLAAEAAYFAVITRDVTGSQKPSPLTAGNYLTDPVHEAPATPLPVLQTPSSDASRKPACCSISGKASLPLWLRLHGSGGRAAIWGDLQAYWGDSAMGYQDGIQSIFAVYEDHVGSAFAKGGEKKLILTPQDAVWSIDGNHGSETYWYGYKVIPPLAKDRKPHVYPYTQAKLAKIVPWAIHHYSADPNRVYGISESMGGYGQVEWSLRHGDIFAAVFMRIPILGPWLHIPSLIDVTPGGFPKTVSTLADTLPDGTPPNEDTDITGWMAQDCSRNLPYVSWSSGRNDVGVANHHMWTYAVQLANTLKTCHYGFSFIWSNGRHDAATAGLENTLLERYQAAFARNLSYPAFTNFSMDQDYGDGDFNNGSPTGCVNCGWQWRVTGDTATSWSASFTNTHVTSHRQPMSLPAMRSCSRSRREHP